MHRFPIILLLNLLIVSGCTDHADMVGDHAQQTSRPDEQLSVDDDAQRLLQINGRFDSGDYEYALEETTRYVQEYPQSFKGWNLLGWSYAKTDELEKAKECFDKSLAINPQWDNAHVGKGAVYRKLGDTDNARKSYLNAIRILPDNAEAYSSLLVIELMEGNDERAVEYGEKAWTLRKDYASIPANLAVAYHYLGNETKRDEYYQHADRLAYHRLETLQKIFDGELSIR